MRKALEETKIEDTVNFIAYKQKVQFGLFVVIGSIHWHSLCVCIEGEDGLAAAITDTDVLLSSNLREFIL